MNKKWVISLLFLFIIAATGAGIEHAAQAPRKLEIYHIDVEGGASTLIVTPAGESILIDTGWPGFDGRDAKRIEAAMKKAGVQAIDHLIITHYHTDHFGGVQDLAARVKINQFYDHGPMPELQEDREFAKKYAAWQALAKGQTITLKAGNTIKLKQAANSPPVYLRVLAAAGEVVSNTQMAGAVNPTCANVAAKPADPSDNARSVVVLLRHGAFDFLDTGDLTWNNEQKLVCPQNLIGEVDLFQVSHHGMNTSNNTALIKSILPTVAIMNNGAAKGGEADTIKAIQSLPLLADLYQLHRNVRISPDQNVSEEFIANIDDKNDTAAMIRVKVDLNQREFSVTNERTNRTQNYPIK